MEILTSEKTLYALQEIERNPNITQRDLAQRLEISLGKLNFLVKALMAKGMIEIKNFKNSKSKLAYKYLLTPQGIKIKIELTHKFFISKAQEYERLKEEIERLGKETAVNFVKEEAV
jgi:EPS-associated MarR family transcriptional regulator